MIISVILLPGQEIPDLLLPDAKPKFAFRSFEINYNVLRLSENALNKPKTSQEFQAELGIHERYFIVADLGFAKTNRGDTYKYESKGSYWRTGIDVNMSKDPNSGMIGIGFRYAQANFEDNITYSKTIQDQDGLTLTQDLEYTNSNLSAEWAELVFKMRVKIWKKFYAGYTMRYQFFLQLYGADEELKPFDVPGYGKTTRLNSFGFDYYVGWRANF